MKDFIETVAAKRIITIFVTICVFLLCGCTPEEEDNVTVEESAVPSSEEFTDSRQKDVVIPETYVAEEEYTEKEYTEETHAQELENFENVENQSISFEDFGEMDYALFLETNVGYGVTLDYFKYGIYGDFVNTVREGEEVYFRLCKTMLGTEISWNIHQDWARNMGILHIQNLSPDLQWIAARQYLMEAVSGFYKDEVFYNGDAIAEAESSSDVTDTYFYFKRTEQGTYEPVSNTLFEKRAQLVDELGGYTVSTSYMKDATCLDEYGKYLAISAPDSQSIGIYSTEDWGLKRLISMEHIDMEYPIAVSQLVGDESSGWLVFSNGGSTYRLDYPDGKAEKIGKLYYEWDEIQPGWYIREIETGNTVYIPIALWEQDNRPLYGGRCVWIEKDKLTEIN